MKITRKQLRRLIKEELGTFTARTGPERPKSTGAPDGATIQFKPSWFAYEITAEKRNFDTYEAWALSPHLGPGKWGRAVDEFLIDFPLHANTGLGEKESEYFTYLVVDKNNKWTASQGFPIKAGVRKVKVGDELYSHGSNAVVDEITFEELEALYSQPKNRLDDYGNLPE